MKKIFFNLLSLASCVAVAVSCSIDGGTEIPQPEGGRIILDFSNVAKQSRAVEDNSVEAAVDQVDVFIFEEDGTSTQPKVHYERITSSATHAVLNVSRSSFDASKRYWVHLLANATASEADFAAITTLAELKQMQQQDDRIHITGLDIEGAPQRFLMDGVAYVGDSEPLAPSAIPLNDGNFAANTKLKVTLRRAAAKIVVIIKRGDTVTFSNLYQAGYYIHNLPYTTPLLAGVDPQAELRSPDKTNNKYFDWRKDVITVTAYAYPHNFDGESSMEKRTTLIVDIPMSHNGSEYPNNYYQIPISKSHIIARNTLYTLTVVINAPGAEDVSHPVVVEPLVYDTAPWTEVGVSVGGEYDSPKYLNVNREQMEMRYNTTDSTTLYFASSSDVTVTTEEVYYINKMGNRVNESNSIKNQIKATVNAGELTGNITITSPLPENKTIRYIKLKVTNKDGFSREVLVEQYPLEFITNIQSWYSYRDDFKDDNTEVTTYETPGSRETAVSLEVQTSGSGWNQTATWTGGYTYHKGTASSGFWRSKVVSQVRSDGSSTIQYYYWNNNTRRTSSASASTNARMYHIRITSTSADYKLGNPKLTNDGYTDPSAENALLVSPSFMIASGLGYFDSNTGNLQNLDKEGDEFLQVVREHCARYVEVYKDANDNKVVLDDWRLPTEKELGIIMEYQGTQGDTNAAIDYLLNAEYYWAANRRIENDKAQGSNGITAVRCIRDAIAKK